MGAGLRAFLIAGEASGDALGGALMAGLRELGPVEFDGVGGEAMQAQGLASRFPMTELSVMGIAEVLPKYFHLKRRIRELADAVIATRPDVLIGIDSPDFCLRVARLVKDAIPDMPVVHYVAPSVWAWRPGRAVKMARVVDHVLALLPFEPPYMQAAGMSCDFVGHPISTEQPATPDQVAAFRARHGIDGPVTLFLPGSRRGEVARMAPRLDQAIAQAGLPGRVVLPAVPHVAPMLRAMDLTTRPLIVEDADDRRAAFAAGDLALATSGTVSLDLALNAVPMVIGYDMAFLSRIIIRRMMLIDTFTLVNLVSETRAVPEFIGFDCKADAMARALRHLQDDPAARQAQIQAMRVTMERLGLGGPPPGLRAARSVVEFLQRRNRIQPPPSTRVPSGS